MSKYVGFRLGKVHESHVISEYYCGGCGWPVTDHDSFCPECGGAFRECDASNLEAENAKLRESVKRLMTQRDERLARAEADNAKLRELAAGIGHLLFVLDVDYCAICPRDDINHPCPVHTVNGGDCLYEADLRELGVEVG